MKPDFPVFYRTNFATALLLANLPGGAVSTLFEVKEKDHPSVLRLQNALDVWQKRTSWWQRLNWKLGVTPAVPIKIDFEPGEFFDPLTASLRRHLPRLLKLGKHGRKVSRRFEIEFELRLSRGPVELASTIKCRVTVGTAGIRKKNVPHVDSDELVCIAFGTATQTS